MEVSKKQDLVIRVREARKAAEAAEGKLSGLVFEYAAGFVKGPARMAIVAAAVRSEISKIVTALHVIEGDISMLEVPD